MSQYRKLKPSLFLEHGLFGFFKLVFEGGRFFHGFAQGFAPFIGGVGRVAGATASHFHAEGDSGGKNFDNFRVGDDPRFARRPSDFQLSVNFDCSAFISAKLCLCVISQAS